jgi:hypothetical protein
MEQEFAGVVLTRGLNVARAFSDTRRSTAISCIAVGKWRGRSCWIAPATIVTNSADGRQASQFQISPIRGPPSKNISLSW